MRTAVLFVCCLLAVCTWVRIDRDAQERQDLAASWSQDGPAFAAIGIDGKTLDAYLPDALSAEHDSFVDFVLVDRNMVKNLREVGFKTLQCGTRREALKDKGGN
jgi:hypothetical protein